MEGTWKTVIVVGLYVACFIIVILLMFVYELIIKTKPGKIYVVLMIVGFRVLSLPDDLHHISIIGLSTILGC